MQEDILLKNIHVVLQHMYAIQYNVVSNRFFNPFFNIILFWMSPKQITL